MGKNKLNKSYRQSRKYYILKQQIDPLFSSLMNREQALTVQMNEQENLLSMSSFTR